MKESSSYLPTNIIATFNFQKRYNPFPLVGIKNSADSFVFGIGASQALPVLEVEADPKCFVSTQLQTRCFGWKTLLLFRNNSNFRNSRNGGATLGKKRYVVAK